MKTLVLKVDDSRYDDLLAYLKGFEFVDVADEQVWANEKSLLEKRLKDLKEGKESVFLWDEVRDFAFSKP